MDDDGLQGQADADVIARFERLIAPIDHASFADGYLGRAFMHQAGEAGRFASLAPWDDVNRVLTTQRLEPPRLILVRGGKTIPPDRYLHSSGANVRIDAGAVSALLAQGATMVLSFIDEMLPQVGAVADDVAAALMARTNVNLYAGWRADQGFDLHWDHHDVFILQVAGRKHWRVHKPTREHPLRGEVCDPPGEDDKPVFDAVLEDGEVLYIPRGWWHVATPVAEPSLHLTVATIPLNGLEYLRWLCERMAADSNVRQDLPFLADAAARSRHIESIGERFIALSKARPLEEFYRDRAAQLPARPRFVLPAFATMPSSERLPDSRVRLAGVRQLAIERSATRDACHFDANGRRWDCSRGVGAALERLSSRKDIAFDDLAMGLAEADRTELTRLVMMLTKVGVLFVES